MKNCQAKDCPAPNIPYEELNKLTNKLEVCTFCYARLTASEKEYSLKETIKKPSEGLSRIPIADKGNIDSTKTDNEEVTLIKSFQSDSGELEKWNSFLRSLKELNTLTTRNFYSMTDFQSFLNPIIFYSENQSLLIYPSPKKTSPSMLSLNTILEKLFSKYLKKSIKIDAETIDSIFAEIIEKYWNKFKLNSKNDFNLEIVEFKSKVLPLKHFIDNSDYPQVNKTNLVKDLSLTWLLWICGYKDILESIFIELLDNNQTINLIFLGNNNFTTSQSKDSEKSMFQDFALYLPFILDNYNVFREEMVRLKENLTKSLLDKDFKESFDNLVQGEVKDFPIFEY
ncbi:MAG: hypothetical protein ACW981_00500 [Candidatus Hodarchaeales archaeon]|jgi:hypothetical protein